MGILIGMDPHKATNAVAAIDERGELLEYAVFSTNRPGLRSLARWGKRFPKRRWAVEGAGGLGRSVRRPTPSRHRRDGRGRIPAKLSSRVRLLAMGNALARTTGWTPFTSPWPRLGASGSPIWARKRRPRY